MVVQDLDKPTMYGAFWGEVNSNIHKALGCVGTITDGGIRDTDEHGFLMIPEEDQDQLLEAARFMDSNECKTTIQSARSASGKSHDALLSEFNAAAATFGQAARARFGKKGEW